MAHWTKYDQEVQAQRQQLRSYGLTQMGITVDFLPPPPAPPVAQLALLEGR